jgi:hypothetical protein
MGTFATGTPPRKPKSGDNDADDDADDDDDDDIQLKQITM